MIGCATRLNAAVTSWIARFAIQVFVFATLLFVTAFASYAQVVITLANFNGTNGASPQLMSLIRGSDGAFYGTTSGGGSNSGGTVFRITPGGTLTTLYSFCSQAGCADGENPLAGLIQANDGNFYGTTSLGGAHRIGTVFKLTPGGTLTTLHSFCSQFSPPNACQDGTDPTGSLIQATDGNFYGTTATGGGDAANEGTIFKLTPGGVLTTLYVFCSQLNCVDGEQPIAGLVQGTDGNFYGTTRFGGIARNGTIFKITPGGSLTTLYSFCSQTNCADGAIPIASLIQATDGNFYGTTALGGPAGVAGFGTVFKVTPSGALTTLYSFCTQANCPDGSQPAAGLVQGNDGNFYGTTTMGGTNNLGTIFQITPSGTLTTLHSFNGTDGGNHLEDLYRPATFTVQQNRVA